MGLAVTNVSSLADYARVMAYLEGLTAVRAVSVRSLKGDGVVFGLQLIGSVENVDRAIRLGNLLQPDPRGRGQFATPEAAGARPVALAYRLQP